ncbi:arginine deiminase-related protein [Legionella genomosp. 1]|uniref:arginine deiminase-related protein n=1 Tax=Legionella genomosp. 1 TaxID=1093625 RepID=UPI0010542975|nr:arginine deiminase-related protein [Legionella genomosp. 1]
MPIDDFPFSEAPNAALIRLTNKFGYKSEEEFEKEDIGFDEKIRRLRAALVYEEMSHLKQQIEAQGIEVYAVDEDTYIENNKTYYYPYQVFLTDTGHYYSSKEALFFIPGYFRKDSRQGEEKTPIKQAEKLGARIQPLSPSDEQGIYFEGGDFLKAPDRALYFLGYGQRTEKKAYAVISQIIDEQVIPIQLLRKEFFHLDCCLTPLPNDVLLLYEGEYIRDKQARLLKNKQGLPLLIKHTQTISDYHRAYLRKLYDPEKIILLSTPEAIAYGANGLILKSNADSRYKMFVNGSAGATERESEFAVYDHFFSLSEKTRDAILSLTENRMDIIEVPYSSLHYAFGSVHCTIEEFYQTKS